MKCKLEIEVISPLFIGNGEKYAHFEYVYDGVSFYPINIEKLVEEKLREEDKTIYNTVINGIENLNLNELCKGSKIDYRKYARYSLVSPNLDIKRDVYQFIKTGGKVYIPGTSIKGALRSVLTKQAVNPNTKPGYKYFTESINEAFKNLNKGRKSDSDSDKTKYLDDEADEKVFGKTYDSPFRFISISDSNLQEPDVLKVFEIKILNICDGEPKWFSRKINVTNPRKALSLYCEGIKEESKFLCTLILGEVSPYVLKESETKSPEMVMSFDANISQEDRKQRIRKHIRSFISSINEEIKEYINNEISFFKKYSFHTKPITEFYSDLLENFKSLKENEFLLQVGFGTGMLSKTILQYLDDNEKSKVAKISKHSYYGGIYPKTRRIVFENGHPKYVPGWIKCKLLPN